MKRRQRKEEDVTFFIDLNISCDDLIDGLRKIGLTVIGYHDVFTNLEILDPEIIRKCDKESWILLTGDKDIVIDHFPIIKQTKVVILMFTQNQQNPKMWAQALVKCKQTLIRHCRTTPRPFVARIGLNGITKLQIIRETDSALSESQLVINDGIPAVKFDKYGKEKSKTEPSTVEI